MQKKWENPLDSSIEEQFWNKSLDIFKPKINRKLDMVQFDEFLSENTP